VQKNNVREIRADMSKANRSYRMWVQPDVLGLFSESVGSYALLVKAAYSTANLPLIPQQRCHLFHTKVATDSTANLPSIPGECCH
jgi:hypothetical protein